MSIHWLAEDGVDVLVCWLRKACSLEHTWLVLPLSTQHSISTLCNQTVGIVHRLLLILLHINICLVIKTKLDRELSDDYTVLLIGCRELNGVNARKMLYDLSNSNNGNISNVSIRMASSQINNNGHQSPTVSNSLNSSGIPTTSLTMHSNQENEIGRTSALTTARTKPDARGLRTPYGHAREKAHGDAFRSLSLI